MAIVSFRNTETKEFIETGIAPRNCPWQSVTKIALRKLDMLNYVKSLEDLKAPPGNRRLSFLTRAYE